jgi:uncharacterized DUF497 family protein
MLYSFESIEHSKANQQRSSNCIKSTTTNAKSFQNFSSTWFGFKKKKERKVAIEIEKNEFDFENSKSKSNCMWMAVENRDKMGNICERQHKAIGKLNKMKHLYLLYIFFSLESTHSNAFKQLNLLNKLNSLLIYCLTL